MPDTDSDCSDIEQRRRQNYRRLSQCIDISSEESDGNGSNDGVLETRPKLCWTCDTLLALTHQHHPKGSSNPIQMNTQTMSREIERE